MTRPGKKSARMLRKSVAVTVCVCVCVTKTPRGQEKVDAFCQEKVKKKRAALVFGVSRKSVEKIKRRAFGFSALTLSNVACVCPSHGRKKTRVKKKAVCRV